MDTKKSARLNVYCSAQDADLIRQAAAEERRSVTSFVTVAALDRAKNNLAANQEPPGEAAAGAGLDG